MTLSKARVKYLRSLKLKKFRDQEKKFLVEGFRLTSEAISSEFAVELLVHTSEFVRNSEHAKLVEDCRKRRVDVAEVSQRDLDSFADTVTSQGVAALVRQRQYRLEDLSRSAQRPQVIVALDAVSEPGNAGTIIRTADWFGVSAVLMGRGGVELYNPKVVRSTMGSLFHLPIVTDANLNESLKKLRGQGFVIIAADVDAKKSYDEIPILGKVVIIFGNEAHGLSSEISGQVDHRVAINRLGNAESLNVGVACGILLARFCSRR
jgi:TrmH family RNA methyltransferase